MYFFFEMLFCYERSFLIQMTILHMYNMVFLHLLQIIFLNAINVTETQLETNEVKQRSESTGPRIHGWWGNRRDLEGWLIGNTESLIHYWSLTWHRYSSRYKEISREENTAVLFSWSPLNVFYVMAGETENNPVSKMFWILVTSFKERKTKQENSIRRIM